MMVRIGSAGFSGEGRGWGEQDKTRHTEFGKLQPIIASGIGVETRVCDELLDVDLFLDVHRIVCIGGVVHEAAVPKREQGLPHRLVIRDLERGFVRQL